MTRAGATLQTRGKSQARQAVVLLSGGLDSTTALAIAQREGYQVYAITFRYGQRHAVEIEAARRVARQAGVAQHIIVDFDLRMIGGSALTADVEVPKGRPLAEMGQGIPITYVPARNTIFLSFALAWAEVLGAHDIFLGVNALDYSGYPDCRPEYIAAYEQMANLATKAGVEGQERLKIHTPLIQMSKAQIIRRGLELGVDYGLTITCYDPTAEGAACGQCDACLLRLRGFVEAGVMDPVQYASQPDPMETPLGQLLAEYDPAIRGLFMAAQALVHSLMPTSVEEIDPKAKLLGFSFVPGTYKGLVLTLRPAKDHVSMILGHGAQLQKLDSTGLLEGTGKIARHIKIKTQVQLEDANVRELILASCALTEAAI